MTAPTSGWKQRLRAVAEPLLTQALKGGCMLLDSTNDIWIFSGSSAPTDGTSGTGAGVAGPGSVYLDYTNINLYMNENTKASPTWDMVAGAGAIPVSSSSSSSSGS